LDKAVKNIKQLSVIKSQVVIYLLLACCFLQRSAIAQGKKPDKVGGVITVVNGKTMTAMDSAMVQQLFFSALREKTIEDTSKASDLFTQVLQINPANDASLYELAKLKKAQNNYAEATPLLEKAVTVNPNNEWYWIALADNYEKSNDVGKLENVFNELIKINPDNTDYYYDKANAYFLQKRYDDALKVYDQIEQLNGLSDDLIIARQKIYLKQGRVDMAAAQLEQMIEIDPAEMKYYLLLAEIYNSNNLNDKAIKVLEKAKKINSNDGLVHLALADIYKDKKNNKASFNELQLAFAIPDVDINQKIRIVLDYLPKFPDPNAKASALELSKILVAAYPADAKAYALYAEMLVQNEKYLAAKPIFQKSIELDNKVYEVREQLVRIELSTNDIDGVIKDGGDALSYFPNQAWMNYLVGIAWVQKRDYNKALGYIKDAISLAADDKEVLSLSLSTLGDCYHELKNTKSSDEAYDQSLSYNPDNVYTLNNYAYYLSVRGEQLEKAAQMAKHANEIQADNSSFEDTYAWVLFKQKKYTEARGWIEKALAHSKDKNAILTEHYADILFYLGETDTAVQNWKKAKEYGGNSPGLQRKINEKKYIE
jgi:tetratricopeptide (TPR) repeat protein